MASTSNPREANAPMGSSANQPESAYRHEGREAAPGLGTHLLNKAEAMGTQMRDKAQELGSQAQALGTQAKETLSEYYEQGRDRLQALPHTMEAQIRERPLQALLIAGGVGLLLGLLWRRS